MNKAATPDVVVVGSVAFDSVQTPKARHEKLLGGSASYTSVAAALFARTGIVGVVGEDFPPEYVEIFERAGVDLQGPEASFISLGGNVIGRDHNNCNVGNFSSPGTHSRKRFVTRRIEEGYFLAIIELYFVGADVLGDSPGFPGDYIRMADIVEQ